MGKRLKWDARENCCGRRKDGALFPAQVGLNPMDTLKGTWLLSSIVDITERTVWKCRLENANEGQ
jgi:hypothetical protein